MANLTGALQSGFEMGRQSGGRLSGIGQAIKGVADRLRAEREGAAGLDLLGRTERIKQEVKAEYAPTPEYAPTTQEEALAFEGGKAKLKAKYATPKEYAPTTQEEALEFEGKKAGLKTKTPEGYSESLSNAVAALEAGKDPNQVFRKMAAAFPQRSAELKRILVPSAKLGELDITEVLWGK